MITDEELAKMVKSIRADSDSSLSGRVLLINLLWSFHSELPNLDTDEIEVSEEEVEEILGQLPTDYETEDQL